jgi:uncharacterized iron-regulated protein
MRQPIAAIVLALLAACASRLPLPAIVNSGAPLPDVLLLGEQHDAAAHQDLQRRIVESLAARGRLAALALEMAEQGASTAGLGADAPEQAVRAALRWEDAAWPWSTYGPAVMSAVRSGAPVVGANLPRRQLREAMADARLDGLLPPPAIHSQQLAIREGHCGLLPDTQVLPMTRVQIARDRAMAQALVEALAPGKTVVLIAGGGHVDPALGVPQHLPARLRVQPEQLPAQPPTKDYCEEMRRRMKASPAARAS